MTVLWILVVVLLAFNVWYSFYTMRLEKERRKKYQDRMEECDERIGEVMNELGKAKQHLSEAQSANAALKRSFDELIEEHALLVRDYSNLQEQTAVSLPRGLQEGPAGKPVKPKRATRKTKK